MKIAIIKSKRKPLAISLSVVSGLLALMFYEVFTLPKGHIAFVLILGVCIVVAILSIAGIVLWGMKREDKGEDEKEAKQ